MKRGIYFTIFLIIILSLSIIGCKDKETTSTAEEVIEKAQEAIEEIEAQEEEIVEEEPIEQEPENHIIIEDTNNTEEEPEEVVKEKAKDVKIIELQMYGDAMQFFPKSIKISAGETVRWINKLTYLNKTTKVTVFARHGNLFREKLGYDEYLDYTFEEPGEYQFGAVPYEYFFKNGKVIVE